VNAQPNASSESWTFRLENLRNRHEMAPLFQIREASLLAYHFELLVDYSFTTSTCRSITCPVNRSMATCTQ